MSESGMPGKAAPHAPSCQIWAQPGLMGCSCWMSDGKSHGCPAPEMHLLRNHPRHPYDGHDPLLLLLYPGVPCPSVLCMEGSVPQTEEKTGVSIQLLYRFLEIFQECSGKIMLFLRQEGLWKEEGKLLYRRLFPLLCAKSPPWPQSSFSAGSAPRSSFTGKYRLLSPAFFCRHALTGPYPHSFCMVFSAAGTYHGSVRKSRTQTSRPGRKGEITHGRRTQKRSGGR